MTGDDAGETATVADQEKAAPPKGRRLLLWVLLSALGLALLGVAGVGGLYLYGKHRYEAEGPLEAPEIVFLKRGMGLNTIARVLEEEGAVESALIFRLGVRLAGLSAALKAGEYEIPAHASMQEIAALLHEGKAILHKVTVPEGARAMRSWKSSKPTPCWWAR